jgi:hypothetical protein
MFIMLLLLGILVFIPLLGTLVFILLLGTLVSILLWVIGSISIHSGSSYWEFSVHFVTGLWEYY